MIIRGDATRIPLPDCSVDAVVTDPPYGLEFMGKEWDRPSDDAVARSWDTKGRAMTGEPQRDVSTPGGRSGAVLHKKPNPRCDNCGRAVNGRATAKGFKVCECDDPAPRLPPTYARKMQAWHELWAREAYRVLKPGGHLLAFGGTRTYHRMTCAIEDAGFEIRDSISWQHMRHVFCKCPPVRYSHATGTSAPPSEADDGAVRMVREDVRDPHLSAQEGGQPDLLEAVQRTHAGRGMGEARPQGPSRMDGREQGQLPPEDDGGAEPSLEGRGHLLAEEGQLPVDQVRAGSGVGAADGSQGPVHHGAPAAHGSDGGTPPELNGGRASSGPRPAEQRPGEPGAVAVEWIPQGGGAWPGCPWCHLPLAPPFDAGPLSWEYGSGFPKSLDVSKALDKMVGAEREVVGRYQYPDGSGERAVINGATSSATYDTDNPRPGGSVDITAPATPEAQQWQGWGTALKPAHEPIVLARKPLTGNVAQNVLRWGTGALNIDGTRLSTRDTDDQRRARRHGAGALGRLNDDGWEPDEDRLSDGGAGRWPPNVTMDEEAARLLDEQSGERSYNPPSRYIDGIDGAPGTRAFGKGVGQYEAGQERSGYGDTGGASRFMKVVPADEEPRRPVFANPWPGCEDYEPAQYITDEPCDLHGIRRCTICLNEDRFRYVPKASRAERNAGLEGMPKRPSGVMQDDAYKWEHDGKGNKINLDTRQQNHHPTVKPLALMRWLVRLVTPPGGLVLDPFLGSGTTLLACAHEGMRGVGIEREAEYVEIAKARNSQPVQQGML